LGLPLFLFCPSGTLFASGGGSETDRWIFISSGFHERFIIIIIIIIIAVIIIIIIIIILIIFIMIMIILECKLATSGIKH
jgi:hypothetical protein